MEMSSLNYAFIYKLDYCWLLLDPAAKSPGGVPEFCCKFYSDYGALSFYLLRVYSLYELLSLMILDRDWPSFAPDSTF